jgi:HEAT repeat protein
MLMLPAASRRAKALRHISTILALLFSCGFAAAQTDLRSADPAVRFRAAQRVKAAPSPEAALPLAALVTDPEDDIQLEAIAAELNIFLARKIVPQRRVGLIIEVRQKVSAAAAFDEGPPALGTQPVPAEVLTALGQAMRDDNRRVGLEALYAFGTLAGQPSGAARREMLRTAGPELAATIGAADPALRLAAVRVIGRLFDSRPGDDPFDPQIGDALISALNDPADQVKSAAMGSLGTLRYDRAVQGLTALFQHYGRGSLAQAAMDALARIAHPASAALFTAQLASKDAVIKALAIEGLARLDDPAALPPIEAALAGERNDGVFLAAQYAGLRLSTGAIDPIAEALMKPRLHDRARQYLIELAPGRSAGYRRYLQDPDGRLRAEIADILAQGGDPAAIAAIEPLMQDLDPDVVAAATRAVARLRGM